MLLHDHYIDGLSDVTCQYSLTLSQLSYLDRLPPGTVASCTICQFLSSLDGSRMQGSKQG